MRILLTGSTGFVGTHLVPLLEAHTYEIIHLVRSPKGFPREVIWDFQGPLPNLPPCDMVVHLAAYVDFKNELSIEQYRVNTLATLKLALFARSHNAHMIFASAAGLQGISGTINEYTPISPPNGYMLSKYLAEESIRSVHDRHTILRIGGIYGLDGPQHLGINTAISEAFHSGNAPTLKGSGNQKRNYICVDDVARWIEQLIGQYENGEHIPPLLYLAGSEIMTIAQYLTEISNVLLGGKEIVREPGTDGNDMIVRASKPPFALMKFKEYLQSIRIA